MYTEDISEVEGEGFSVYTEGIPLGEGEGLCVHRGVRVRVFR